MGFFVSGFFQLGLFFFQGLDLRGQGFELALLLVPELAPGLGSGCRRGLRCSGN